MVRRALLVRLPRLLGAVQLLAGLLLYRSEARDVLGLWSRPFACVVAVTAVVVIWLAVDTFRRASARRQEAVPALLFDAAVGAWGTAYLAAALDAREAGGRLLDGSPFGSVAPVASLLEWFALAFAVSGALLWAASRVGEQGRRAVLSVATFAALWLVAEAAIRAKTVLSPETQGFPTWMERAWLRRHVRLNREGFRDGEHSLEVPAGTRRLLVVGDSFAFGSGIEDVRERFGEQLAARLDPGRGAWEVVTAARGNSHTLDEIGFLERMLAYRPELVILVYVFNDIDYLSPSGRALVAAAPDVLDRLHPIRLLFLNSYAFQELYIRARLARYSLVQRRGARLITGLEIDRSSPYDDPSLFERHLSDLSKFVAQARAAGARVWVVPFELGVLADERQREVYGLFLAGARGAGVPTLDLEHAFDGHSFDELTVNQLDRHPNEAAHRLAATSVAFQLGKL